MAKLSRVEKCKLVGKFLRNHRKRGIKGNSLFSVDLFVVLTNFRAKISIDKPSSGEGLKLNNTSNIQRKNQQKPLISYVLWKGTT